MKKTVALVVTGIIAGAAFVTAPPHRADGDWAPVVLVSVTDIRAVERFAQLGYVVRAVGPCRTAPSCVWLQK